MALHAAFERRPVWLEHMAAIRASALNALTGI